MIVLEGWLFIQGPFLCYLPSLLRVYAISSSRYAMDQAKRNSISADVYMFLSYYRGGGAIGVASTLGGVCSEDKGKRAAITEFTENNMETAWVKTLSDLNKHKMLKSLHYSDLCS